MFYISLNIKQVLSEVFFPAILFASTGKMKLNTPEAKNTKYLV